MMAVVAVAETSALAMERRTFLSAAMGAGITAPLYGCGAQTKTEGRVPLTQIQSDFSVFVPG